MPSKPTSSGSRTATLTGGTGPNGIRVDGTPVPDKQLQPVSEKPKSGAETVSGNVLLQGNAIKSVVAYQFESTEELIFKGRAAMSETKRESGIIAPSHGNGPAAHVTVVNDVKMSVISHSVTVKGIVFGGDDDE